MFLFALSLLFLSKNKKSQCTAESAEPWQVHHPWLLWNTHIIYEYFLRDFMLSIPNRIWSGFWWPAEDALYATYYQMGWRTPWVIPENLVISIALKIEYWLKRGANLNLKNADTAIFTVLSWIVSTKDAPWTWRMAQTIARLGVIQALFAPEISKQNMSL